MSPPPGLIPIALNATDYGWEEIDERYAFKWFEGDQLPPSVESITNDENTGGMTDVIFLINTII